MAFTQQTPIGTPDVNLITETLAKLQPDSALQDYARMHKNDVYIVSLANAESNRRKSLRLAAQGQNAGPQPTVVDQRIAGMAPAPMMSQQQLPENQGIAQIPTPNMQRMADGGIAGYEDDQEGMATGGMGGMFNFAQQSEPVVRMSGGGHIPRYQGNTMDGSVVGGIPGFQAVQPRAEFTQQGAPENTPLFQRIMESMSSGNKERQLAMIAQKIAQGTATAEETAIYQAEIGKKPGQKQMGATKDVVNPDEILMATEKAGKFKTAADKVAADKAPAAALAPQSNLPTGSTSVKQAQDLGSKFYDLKGIEGKLEQAQMQERQDIFNEKEARAAKVEAFNKEQGPAMASYEKLLKGEEMQDATDKEKAGLMSLMKGFLAMAAGESPNAATNIAKGAMVGLGDYGDALKEFKKSAKDRNKAMAEIENARRAEAKGDLKDAQIYEDKANDYMRASKQSGIKAIIDATGKSSEISAGLYKSAAEIASANARTNAQVNAPSGIERIVDRMARDPKFAESYKNYASIGPEAKGYEAELQAYLKNPMMLKATNPDLAAQFDAIIKQRMLKPTSTPTGPIRD
jgi:hypothetical protein